MFAHCSPRSTPPSSANSQLLLLAVATTRTTSSILISRYRDISFKYAPSVRTICTTHENFPQAHSPPMDVLKYHLPPPPTTTKPPRPSTTAATKMADPPKTFHVLTVPQRAFSLSHIFVCVFTNGVDPPSFLPSLLVPCSSMCTQSHSVADAP